MPTDSRFSSVAVLLRDSSLWSMFRTLAVCVIAGLLIHDFSVHHFKQRDVLAEAYMAAHAEHSPCATTFDGFTALSVLVHEGDTWTCKDARLVSRQSLLGRTLQSWIHSWSFMEMLDFNNWSTRIAAFLVLNTTIAMFVLRGLLIRIFVAHPSSCVPRVKTVKED